MNETGVTRNNETDLTISRKSNPSLRAKPMTNLKLREYQLGRERQRYEQHGFSRRVTADEALDELLELEDARVIRALAHKASDRL